MGSGPGKCFLFPTTLTLEDKNISMQVWLYDSPGRNGGVEGEAHCISHHLFTALFPSQKGLRLGQACDLDQDSSSRAESLPCALFRNGSH